MIFVLKRWEYVYTVQIVEVDAQNEASAFAIAKQPKLAPDIEGLRVVDAEPTCVHLVEIRRPKLPNHHNPGL